ncbi:MAG: HNH endonuclease [Bacteroidota bacterium]
METQKCPLCGRVLGEVNISRHHLIPKSKGGTFGETVMLHNICHQKIHAVFSEKELKKSYHTIEQLRAHEQMAKFIKWVRKKESSFYERNKRMNRNKR